MYKNFARVGMSKSKVKGEGHRGQKKRKVRNFVRDLSSGARSSCGIVFRNRPRERFYADGKISACSVVYLFALP